MRMNPSPDARASSLSSLFNIPLSPSLLQTVNVRSSWKIIHDHMEYRRRRWQYIHDSDWQKPRCRIFLLCDEPRILFPVSFQIDNMHSSSSWKRLSALTFFFRNVPNRINDRAYVHDRSGGKIKFQIPGCYHLITASGKTLSGCSPCSKAYTDPSCPVNAWIFWMAGGIQIIV